MTTKLSIARDGLPQPEYVCNTKFWAMCVRLFKTGTGGVVPGSGTPSGFAINIMTWSLDGKEPVGHTGAFRLLDNCFATPWAAWGQYMKTFPDNQALFESDNLKDLDRRNFYMSEETRLLFERLSAEQAKAGQAGENAVTVTVTAARAIEQEVPVVTISRPVPSVLTLDQPYSPKDDPTGSMEEPPDLLCPHGYTSGCTEGCN